MRIRISHDTTYTYGAPVKSAIQILRLTPRNHEGQFVARWKIDIDGEARIARREDWYGNITHHLTLDGPITEIGIRVSGEVETEDQAGVVRGTVERFPPALFLRQTRLSAPDAAIADFAASAAAGPQNALDRLHALMHALHDLVTFDVTATDVVTTAQEAFHAGHGVCQDFAHLMIACLRNMGLPARYVSGYIETLPPPGKEKLMGTDASHAWVAVYFPGVGWVEFDPTNCILPSYKHITVAVGRDYHDVAPIKGIVFSSGKQNLTVKVDVVRVD